ncbi:hypothetical protein L2E82_15482 [Cichorium intybus]|uniref:Uncharacterized protein n=1 Tax=Cichorium intybus TaxID=13427 RepID=A0ACB9F2I6_CICIN|nr:hypothetical protein L2E82_15482 [Cichorium intybus]
MADSLYPEELPKIVSHVCGFSVFDSTADHLPAPVDGDGVGDYSTVTFIFLFLLFPDCVSSFTSTAGIVLVGTMNGRESEKPCY